MDSEIAQKHLRKQQRRLRFRRIRQGILLVVLLVVAFWGWQTYLADHHTFAWDKKVSVAVVALFDNDQGKKLAKEKAFIQRFLSRARGARFNLREVEAWVQKEYTKHSGDSREMFEFAIRGPVLLDEPPPKLLLDSESFWDRLTSTRAFLGYFADIRARKDLLLGQYDLTIFIYFYDFNNSERRDVFSQFDSLASRRDRYGIVFAPVTNKLLGNTCAVVAHELCHVLGASDKYLGASSVFPQGFVDPDQSPLYPQKKAEIMALGRPIADGVDMPVKDLRDCVVGDVTAREMNWLPKPAP